MWCFFTNVIDTHLDNQGVVLGLELGEKWSIARRVESEKMVRNPLGLRRAYRYTFLKHEI